MIYFIDFVLRSAKKAARNESSVAQAAAELRGNSSFLIVINACETFQGHPDAGSIMRSTCVGDWSLNR